MPRRRPNLNGVMEQLGRIGALVPPADPLEFPPHRTRPGFEVPLLDLEPVRWPGAYRLAPVPDIFLDWWTGHPEDPYSRGEYRSLNPATEIIGWYCGYHSHRPERWGIYVRERAITAVAQRLHARMARKGHCDMTVGGVRQLFFDKVWHHEYFHHVVEAAVTRLELRHGLPLYPAWHRQKQFMRHTGQFILEEMCANTHAIQQVSTQLLDACDGHYRSTVALEALMDWMRHQPQGYNAFDQGIGPIHWIRALRSLAGEVLPDHPELHHDFLHDVLDVAAGNGRLNRTGPAAVPFFLVDRL
ncbi:MAG: hypothetical protein VKP57_02785 [Candidatus Sericytochromatia bacterium]|nr:hypothetical protein [Candidatus Sericytochromatia bacterium]